VSRDVVDTLAVHPHLAAVTKRRAVVIACPDHAGLPGSIGTRLGDKYARRRETDDTADGGIQFRTGRVGYVFVEVG